MFLTVCPSFVAAQQPTPAPALYRTGKWVAAGVAVALTAIGISDHNAANRAYNGLLGYCAGGTCTIGPDGHYTDPAAESRYQDVVANDRAARAWLVGGQVALAGAIGMFILELRHARSEPPDIPYHGMTIAPASIAGARVVRIGWRLSLP